MTNKIKGDTETISYGIEMKPYLEEALKQTSQCLMLTNDSIELVEKTHQVFVVVKPTALGYLAEFFRRYGKLTANL